MATAETVLPPQGDDGGLVALATILAMHRISVDPAQMRHELGHDQPVAALDLLRLIKRQPDARGRLVSADFARLGKLPLPALAEGRDGWFILGRAVEDAVLVQRPGEAIEKLAPDQLAERWTGQVILVTTREGVVGASGRFDMTWFIPQIVRYRKLIGEVLLITLALNLLGLAAPLFFQNVIDKVLVHNTLATLQVLSIGLVAVSVWEVLFGWLRTRLYSETSQKIDVELGSQAVPAPAATCRSPIFENAPRRQHGDPGPPARDDPRVPDQRLAVGAGRSCVHGESS